MKKSAESIDEQLKDLNKDMDKALKVLRGPIPQIFRELSNGQDRQCLSQSDIDNLASPPQNDKENYPVEFNSFQQTQCCTYRSHLEEKATSKNVTFGTENKRARHESNSFAD